MNQIALLARIAALLALLTGPLASSPAGFGEWTYLGPGGRAIQCIAIDPVAPTTLYAGGLGGISKSVDGGVSWSYVNAGLPLAYYYNVPAQVDQLLIDPAAPETLYARTSSEQIYKSTDGGGEWHLLDLGPWIEPVDCMAMDPAVPRTLYAGSGYDLYKSVDGGDSWTLISEGGISDPFAVVVVDPNDSNVLYAGGYYDPIVWRSADGGESWSRINGDLPSDLHAVDSLVLDPTSPGTLYVGMGWPSDDAAGFYRTLDDGEHWTKIASSSPTEFGGSLIFIIPSRPQTLYATTSGFLSKSTDSGESWVPVSAGLVNSKVNGLAIDPFDSSTVYVAHDGTGVSKSLDGGETWDWQVSQDGLGEGVATTRVLVDPGLRNTIYAAGEGLFKSLDRGATWSPLSVGVEGWRYDLGMDPLDSRVLYCLVCEPLPARMFRSLDAGESWTPLAGHGIADARDLSLWTVDPVIPNTLYVYAKVGIPYSGIFKSTDGGESWFLIFDDLVIHEGSRYLSHLVINPSDSRVLYLRDTWSYLGTYYYSSTVQRSLDGGQAWESVHPPGSIWGLFLSRPEPSTLFADQADHSWAVGYPGLYKTTSGGDAWLEVSEQLERVRTLVADPLNPETLYASAGLEYNPRFYRSLDGGAVWSALDSGPSSDSHGPEFLTFDPTDSTAIYSAGEGVSRFHTVSGGGGGSSLLEDLNCFIATAAYGSPLEPEVATLRRFRDERLLESSFGRALVHYYYQISPPVAAIIAERPALRRLTRWTLAPVVYGARVLLDLSDWSALVLLGSSSG